MKDKRKICVVVTARPSYSRIKTAIKAIQEHPDLELQLVVAAHHSQFNIYPLVLLVNFSY